MSYNSGVIVLVISNHSPDYSLNCTPLSPITIRIPFDNIKRGNETVRIEKVILNLAYSMT